MVEAMSPSISAEDTSLRKQVYDSLREALTAGRFVPGQKLTFRFVAGEWHNNHHLYPTGARSGFLGYQVDLPWFFIRALHAVGATEARGHGLVENEPLAVTSLCAARRSACRAAHRSATTTRSAVNSS